jgi:hypothetical protein
MIVEFYLNVYRGQTEGFYTNPKPLPVPSGYKQVKFEVDIPMDELFPVDKDLGRILAIPVTSDESIPFSIK